jgi:ferredoxin
VCPKCPANAIFAESDLPAEQTAFLELNAELTAQWPTITGKKEPPSDAEQWNGVEGKLPYLEK